MFTAWLCVSCGGGQDASSPQETIAQPPVANDDLSVTPWNTAAVINVLANDIVSESTLDAASVQVGTAPNSGMAEVNLDGTMTYMPTAGYTGADSFTYTVKDSAGAMSNVATVTVTVLPPSPAQQTAEQNDVCKQVQPFYFEIGDAEGTIASASIGADAPTATTHMEIASGTKWLFGAYVAEVRSSVLSWADLMEMRMLSGYVSMGALRQCDILSTVSSCFNTAPNNAFTATSLGRFDYGSGHFQKWGVDNDLGPMGIVTLAAELQSKLGPDIPLAFSSPTLAGGAFMSASEYAAFLRKILRGELKIAALLGTSPVCTLPSKCPTADFSPIRLAWHYSIGHWVEDDLESGDGSFSSPGALGFYPWIDSTKTYYGIVARQYLGQGSVTDSVDCGRAIRKAFITGVVQ